MPSRIILIRHALSAVDPDVDSTRWGLAPGAEADAAALAHVLPQDIGVTVWTSAEDKALQTAEAIARVRDVRVATDERFGEVSRPWVGGDYRDDAMRYLQGEVLAGWERTADVVDRFSAAIRDIDVEATIAVVNHGLALSLFLASLTEVDVVSFWSSLTFPDAWSFDTDSNEVLHLFHGGRPAPVLPLDDRS